MASLRRGSFPPIAAIRHLKMREADYAGAFEVP